MGYAVDEVGYAVADDEECTDGLLGESKEPLSPSGCPTIDLSKWEKIRIELSTFHDLSLYSLL